MTGNDDFPSINWAGNVRFHARRAVRPSSVPELQELVAAGGPVRAIGAGHSFSPLVDTTGTIVSLDALAGPVEADRSTAQAWVPAGATYGQVAPQLDAAGWALANLASLSQVTVAGACLTGTHGSGVANQCLSSAVTAVEMVCSDGELMTVSAQGQPETFAGFVVSLGALGIMTRLQLALEPTYQVAQDVWLDIPFDGALAELDAVMSAGYSVSLFIDWSRPDVFGQSWVKRRLGKATGDRPVDFSGLGGRAALSAVHPIPGADAAITSSQLGKPGPWYQRLPHFGEEAASTATGAELQSEWLVARSDGPAALERLRPLAALLAPAVLTSEVRAVAADNLWLSPAFERDSLALHFTWRPDMAAVAGLIPVVEQALAPFGPRPHWAKLYSLHPRLLASSYPRLADFRQLVASTGAGHRFVNEFVAAQVLEDI